MVLGSVHLQTRYLKSTLILDLSILEDDSSAKVEDKSARLASVTAAQHLLSVLDLAKVRAGSHASFDSFFLASFCGFLVTYVALLMQSTDTSFTGA